MSNLCLLARAARLIYVSRDTRSLVARVYDLDILVACLCGVGMMS